MATCTTLTVMTYSILYPPRCTWARNPCTSNYYHRAPGVTLPLLRLYFPLLDHCCRPVHLSAQRPARYMRARRDPLSKFSCLRVSNSPPRYPFGRLGSNFQEVRKWWLLLQSWNSPPHGLWTDTREECLQSSYEESFCSTSHPNLLWSVSLFHGRCGSVCWVAAHIFSSRPSIRNAVKKLHAQGVTHGDIADRNIIVHDGKATLIDFSNAYITADGNCHQEDVDAVDQLLQDVYCKPFIRTSYVSDLSVMHAGTQRRPPGRSL
ncbi:hypothetical protein JB92DRAFT_2269709 [Gautieria morchelliformis]|nr:hypothetical protein JB92DRAFT_2269709 [Gautieria morchelliformis]